MAKRKLEGDQLEHNGIRMSKKPRTDRVHPLTDEKSQYRSTDSRTGQPAAKETKEARAARKVAKRLAKRHAREERGQAEAARGITKDLQVEGGTSTQFQPFKVTKAMRNAGNPRRRTSPTAGIVTSPVLPSQAPDVKESKGKGRQKVKAADQNGISEGKIKLNHPRKDNKILGQPRDEHVSYSCKDGNVPGWTISKGVVGGRMLDLDPVYSEDEQYLLIAFRCSINVYSTATSLLVRELYVSHHHRVSAFALSSTDPSKLYVATEDGYIQLFNPLTGQKLHHWRKNTSIYALQTCKPADSEEFTDQVYSINRLWDGPWKISAHRLETSEEGTSEEASRSEVVTLRESQEPITSFKVVEGGKIILATSGSVLTIGHTDHPHRPALDNVSYIWRDVECPEWISSFDIRIVPPDTSSKHHGSRTNPPIARTDIVIGGLKGPLHVYNDLLMQLVRKEKGLHKNANVDLTSRKQHWHRNAVLSVKWSRDGNYIISGGLETTLLIWQLETGRWNTLPHLGAPLDGIVVSPSGSSYAIRLSDNSTMILSTTELKPTFSVAGIQLPANRGFAPQLPYLSNVDIPNRGKVPPQRLHFPVVSGQSGLLCVVPSALPTRVPSALPQQASFLQTIDIASTQQIARQALTRTKATDLNVGPESNTIQEPDIVLMQISHDGRWLATVDEWTPPKRDIAILAYNDERATEEQDSRREIFLKFWSWDNENRIWALVSRADDPHASQVPFTGGQNRVLDLAADPLSNSFATIGENGLVRIWKASARQRHGLMVKNKQGQGLLGWNCKTTISLDLAVLSSQDYTGAKLAYSPDGSCLAAALSTSSPWTVHLIDPSAGTAMIGPYEPLTGPLFGLGIIDRYLIIFSDQLGVWDLVRHELAWAYTLSPLQSLSNNQSQIRHLAVDPGRGTFAIALPYMDALLDEKLVKTHSQVIVFEATSPSPIFTYVTQHPVTTLTTLYDRPGYLTITSAAEIQTFTPGRSRPLTSMALPTPPQTPSRGLEGIYGDPNQPSNTTDDVAEEPASGLSANIPALIVEEPHVAEDDAVVVTQQKLTEVLDCGPAYAMPPVTELFERVARLYAGRRET
ncbi:MAG: hypothetical protein Q9166_002409 [cf. Caloplaca sp. 2 TL-2023]